MIQQRRHLMVPALTFGSGGGIRTPDLWVMSPTSCRCSPPRRVLGLGDRGRGVEPFARRLTDAPPPCWGWGVSAAASPPVGSPPQYSPALRWVTTGFGMGPGGASTLSATGTPHPPQRRAGAPCCARAAGSAPHAPVRSPARPVQQHRPSPSRLPGFGRRQVRGLPLARRGLPLVRRVSPPAGASRPAVGPRLREEYDAGDPPSTIRTARLQSVARGPPAAYQPGHLPGVLPPKSGDARLGEGFPLRCFQRFARPHVATQRCRSRDNWHTSGASTPVLSY